MEAHLRKLIDCEQKQWIIPALNLFPLAELLKHLEDKNDPAYILCLQAVQVTFWHTSRDGTVNFIPPPEFEVCQECFGRLPSSFQVFLNKVGQLYNEVLNDSNEKNLEKLRPAFQQIGKWVLNYKQSFIESYSAYLNETDPLHSSNWSLFPGKENKKERINYIAHLRKDDRKLELAIGLFLFIERHLDFKIEWTQEDFISKAEQLKNQRPIGFEMMLSILEKCLHSNGYNLSKGKNPNDIIDFLFALSLDIRKDRILVSGDNALHLAAKELRITEKVMKLDTYLKVIGFL